ncbi:hypothetical protein ACAW75_11000 [Fibrella sp. Tmos10]
MRLGTMRLGTMRLGTLRLGTLRLGTARLGDGNACVEDFQGRCATGRLRDGGGG